MVSYGWTLDEVLKLTIPQVRELFGAMTKYPPVVLFTSGLLESFKGGKNHDVGKLEDIRRAGGNVNIVGTAEMKRKIRSLLPKIKKR